MGYRMMGRGHAALTLLRARLAQQAGQGTVEYVALILLDWRLGAAYLLGLLILGLLLRGFVTDASEAAAAAWR